jgi:hypothetical protein
MERLPLAVATANGSDLVFVAWPDPRREKSVRFNDQVESIAKARQKMNVLKVLGYRRYQ